MAAAKKSAAGNLPVLMTVDEFLAWPGDGTGLGYDLVDGQLRAHAAPSPVHARMHSTVCYLVTGHLRQHHPKCSVFIGAGIKPLFRTSWNFRIPDLAVTCGRSEKDDRELPEPIVIIELLSPSNKADTWDNVRNYMTLPSVREIAVIETDRVHAHLFGRTDDGTWPADPLEFIPGHVIPLASIGYDLRLAEAYAGTYLAG
jgi:Uma2 family endonuclease